MRRKLKETDRFTLALHGFIFALALAALIYPLIRFLP